MVAMAGLAYIAQDVLLECLGHGATARPSGAHHLTISALVTRVIAALLFILPLGRGFAWVR